MHTRAKNILISSALLIILLILVGAIYLRSIYTSGLPKYDGLQIIPGIKNKVTVYRDKYAIPHIYAQNEADLYCATGYVMAQDRLWQMDLLRRVTQGRLSEIFGKDFLPVDRLMRTLRFTYKSKLILAKLSAPAKKALYSYVAGVNHYIKQQSKKFPFEFCLLGYKPTKWLPTDTLNLVGFIAWNLSPAWNIEIALHKLRNKVGEKRFNEFTPFIKKDTISYPGVAKALQIIRKQLANAYQKMREKGLIVFNASNSWSIAGKRTASGKPILANDMHLELSLPGVWYQMHQIVSNGMNVTGVALPGAPFIVSGHNQNIAWGATVSYVDDMDFYLEKINPKNRAQYQFKGQWKNIKSIPTTYKIKGEKTLTEKIRFTHHGPIISDLKNIKKATIAMRWTGNQPSGEFDGIYKINHAANWQQFKQGVKGFTAISLNLNYADTKGNIGLYYAAGIPIRNGAQNFTIFPGWTGKHEWRGLLPLEKKPNLYNPRNGIVVSANNRATDERYPHYISNWYRSPYRINRIKAMLGQKQKITTAYCKKIQLDLTSTLAQWILKDIIAILKQDTPLTATEKQALALLQKWDHVKLAKSAAAAIFERFYMAFLSNTFLDEMGEKLLKEISISPLPLNHAFRRLWKKESIWYDNIHTKKQEQFKDIVIKSFKDAVALLDNEQGGCPKEWQWGQTHNFTISHPLGVKSILNTLFALNAPTYKVGGSFDTVCMYSYKFNHGYRVYIAPSQRHVYDLSNWDKSYVAIPGGNSGHPASPHYIDQVDDYMHGRYRTDYFSKALVRKNARYKMVLLGK